MTGLERRIGTGSSPRPVNGLTRGRFSSDSGEVGLLNWPGFQIVVAIRFW